VYKLSTHIRATSTADKSAPRVRQRLLVGGRAVVDRATAGVDVQQLAAVNAEP